MSTNHQALLCLDNQTCAVIGSTVATCLSPGWTTTAGRKLGPNEKKNQRRTEGKINEGIQK